MSFDSYSTTEPDAMQEILYRACACGNNRGKTRRTFYVASMAAYRGRRLTSTPPPYFFYIDNIPKDLCLEMSQRYDFKWVAGANS